MTIQPTSPAQRTASTARAVLMAGLVFALEAMWRGSIARTLMAACVLIAGVGLLVFARRTAG